MYFGTSHLRVTRYSSRSAASWAVRPAIWPSGISDVRDGLQLLHVVGRQDDLLVLAVAQHDRLLVALDQQAGQRHGRRPSGRDRRRTSARSGATAPGCSPADPPRERSLPMVDRSGPTGVPRSPTLWQLPQLTACDQNSFSPRPASPCEGQDRLRAAGSSRACAALSRPRADSPRTGRGSGRPAASPPRPAARPARRASARRGRASARAAAPTSGRPATGPAGRRPASVRVPRRPFMPAIHCSMSFSPASSGVRSRCAASGRGRTWPCGSTACSRTGRPA